MVMMLVQVWCKNEELMVVWVMQTLIWDKMVTVWPCLTLDIAWWSDLIDISMFTITIIILNGGSFNPHFLYCTNALDFTRIEDLFWRLFYTLSPIIEWRQFRKHWKILCQWRIWGCLWWQSSSYQVVSKLCQRATVAACVWLAHEYGNTIFVLEILTKH